MIPKDNQWTHEGKIADSTTIHSTLNVIYPVMSDVRPHREFSSLSVSRDLLYHLLYQSGRSLSRVGRATEFNASLTIPRITGYFCSKCKRGPTLYACRDVSVCHGYELLQIVLVSSVAESDESNADLPKIERARCTISDCSYEKEKKIGYVHTMRAGFPFFFFV